MSDEGYILRIHHNEPGSKSIYKGEQHIGGVVHVTDSADDALEADLAADVMHDNKVKPNRPHGYWARTFTEPKHVTGFHETEKGAVRELIEKLEGRSN